MPEFQLDTTGEAYVPLAGAPHARRALLWRDLDAFTQGYVEAAFFTSNASDNGPWDKEAVAEDRAAWDSEQESGDIDGVLPWDAGFADLAPETLAAMIEDCRAFQAAHADTLEAAAETPGYGPGEERGPCDEAHAGRDFWYTRNRHGCGFWDGDWPEPYATQLTDAAHAFGEVYLYLGDDGKVHCA